MLFFNSDWLVCLLFVLFMWQNIIGQSYGVIEKVFCYFLKIFVI